VTTRVSIRPVTPTVRPPIVFELIGDDEPSGGVGGWQTLPRPRRTTGVYWGGTPEVTWTLPLMLDGMEVRPGVDRVIEAELARVASWGRSIRPKRVTLPPPVLQVSGPLHFPSTTRWVLQDLAYGARERNSAGRRIRQELTLTLLEYIEPQLVKSHAKKSRGKDSKDKDRDKGKGGKG